MTDDETRAAEAMSALADLELPPEDLSAIRAMVAAGYAHARKIKAQKATVPLADGDSPCVLEWGAVSLPVCDQSRVTEMKLCPTLWAAIAEGALCGFDWRVYPLALTPAASAPAPAAVPLTMERAWHAVKEADIDWHTGWAGDPLEVNRYLQLIRIVERAHGIGA